MIVRYIVPKTIKDKLFEIRHTKNGRSKSTPTVKTLILSINRNVNVWQPAKFIVLCGHKFNLYTLLRRDKICEDCLRHLFQEFVEMTSFLSKSTRSFYI
nr:MAG TPA: hypothetical protein [Caudoviricetes sp.]